MKEHFSNVKTLTGCDETKKERKFNMMMLSVVTFFIISYSFDNTFFVLWYFNVINIVFLERILMSFSAVLLTLNSSVNVFFYSYFNQNFRKVLVKLLFCKKGKLNQKINTVAMKQKNIELSITEEILNDQNMTSIGK